MRNSSLQWRFLGVLLLLWITQIMCGLPASRFDEEAAMTTEAAQRAGVTASPGEKITVAADADSDLFPSATEQVLQQGGRASVTIVEQPKVQPQDLQYLGAFRLPEGDERPRTFAHGGNAMTYSPLGDPDGPEDGYPGSLFITGHDRLPYSELPDGSQVAEVSIPSPVLSGNLEDLNRAQFLQRFRNVAEGYFVGLDELPRIGMLFLDHPATGPKIHLAWGAHFQPEPQVASHAWFDPDLSVPNLQGPWFIEGLSPYSVNGYLFEIPQAWADRYVEGRSIGTGRYRDGGWSGMGPSLVAYRPWSDEAGTPALPGSSLAATVLLQYASSETSEVIERCLEGYQHADEWEGVAWLTTASGKSAVIVAGTKGTGEKYWYGYPNPSGPQIPCVDEEMVGQFPVCRMADGTPCPPEDLKECDGHSDYRGWWSARFNARIIFYNPADLARVVLGELQPWQPQPYAYLDIDEHLFHNPAAVELEMLGSGIQRRYQIGDVAYDRANGLLYILELFADGTSPVVHVWRLE